MVSNKFYIHEAELGNQLSTSVHEQRHSDFSLMLAMLVDDIREHSQFHLPQTQKAEVDNTNQLLRRQFELPKPAKISDESLAYQHYGQSQQIGDGNSATIRLQQALTPEPLAQFNEPKRIHEEVLANISGYCKSRHLAKVATKETLQRRSELNVELFVKAVQASRLKAATTLVA